MPGAGETRWAGPGDKQGVGGRRRAVARAALERAAAACRRPRRGSASPVGRPAGAAGRAIDGMAAAGMAGVVGAAVVAALAASARD